MTIDLPAPLSDAAGHPDALVQFVYRAVDAPRLLASARALLAATPDELAESFEQALRGAGIAS